MKVSRAAKLVAASGVVAGAVAAAAVAANPVLRDEARRFQRMARPLGQRSPGAPIPPPLPPGRVVDVPGRGEVFVRDTGASEPERPAVLLLHGWTSSADLNFFTSFDELSSAYRVVAPDHRGHGRGLRSEEPFSLEDCADDAAALVRHLGVGPAVVVGYSMGGAIAMLLWHRHPALVRGIVFSGTALEWHDSVRDRVMWRGMSLFEVALRNGTGDGFVERFLRETVEDAPTLAPYKAWVTGELHRGYPADLAGAGRALAAYDGVALARGMNVPCAVVLTARDTLVPPAKQRRLARATDARVFEVDGDHQVPFNRGPVFAAVLRAAVDHVVGEGEKAKAQ